MKKFSKSAHQSLTELNITPLLDLCFVLLVIFIITTAPVVNDMDLNLPKAAKREKEPESKVNYVSVSADGQMYLNRQLVDPLSLLDTLIAMRTTNSDLNVVIRGDGKTKYRHILSVLDALQQANIGKVNLATQPGSP